MRSLQLQTALTRFLEQAATQLHAEVAAGAEVRFELEPRMGRRGSLGTALYCYRALTGEFLSERQPALARLPCHGEAVRALEGFDGLDRYLATVTVEPPPSSLRARAAMALLALLGEVFDEQSDFELHPERVRSALERLEQAAHGSPRELTIVASLHGLVIGSAELALARGLAIAAPDALEGVPDALAANVAGQAAGHLLVVLSDEEDDPHVGIARGREVLRDLLRALRLFGDGRVTLGAIAWTRVGAGAWTPLALGTSGRPHGVLVVSAEQEDELRAFCSLVSRRAPHGNELAWALDRFELGCEREDPYQALTDHLLALRVLLEPEGAASGLLPPRLAALCATPDLRDQLAARMAEALELERAVVAGEAVEHAGGHTLARDVSDHLRALLRDVICGHLAPELVALADELLTADAHAREDADAALAADAATGGDADVVLAADAAGADEPLAAEFGEQQDLYAYLVSGGGEGEDPRSSPEQVLGDAGKAAEILDLII